ncbi:MAG: hypothetical protein ACT4ON_14030 [Bacteroidota bacterium]
MKKLIILLLMSFILITCKQTNKELASSDHTLDTTIINGVYKGKNLFFQNKQLNENKFCIQKIFLNDNEVISDIKSTAFELMLSDKLELEKPFQLMIIHYKTDALQYRILNPEAIQIIH